MVRQWLALTLVLTGCMLAETSRPVPCPQNLCHCFPKENIARCNKKNLTYIPELPPYVTRLEFSNNLLQRVTPKSFHVLTSLRLVELNLTSDSIRSILPHAFSNLHHLQRLNLDGNVLSLQTISGLFPSLSKLPLSTLSLGHLKIRSTEIFQNFRSSHLRKLNLTRNQLKVYNHTDFTSLSNLEVLDMSHNTINSIFLDSSFTLKVLNLRANKISEFPNFCNGRTLFPNLETLKLDTNSLDSIDGENIRCLQKLFLFSSNRNKFRTVKQNTFSGLPSLEYVIMRGLIGDIYIEKYAFNNSNIKYISLTHGGIHFKQEVHPDAFRDLSNIDSIDASYNVFFNSSDDDMDHWFSHLTTLTGIGLGNCGIKQYPMFIPQKLNRLKYLKLYSNHIDTLPADAFKTLKNLRHLWLTNNQIAKIKEEVFPHEVRKRLHSISLMNNPFACNCELLWFLTWSKDQHQKFAHYPKKYVCDSPGDRKGELLSKVNLTKYKCLIPFPVSLSLIGCLGFFILILVVSTLTYRWRWVIRYYIYRRRTRNEETWRRVTDDMIYDAYVIYSVKDIRWIKSELIETMENKEGKILYIRDRDSTAGDPKVDNVVNNLARSCSVLVILSNAMARDEECQFELMLIQKTEERVPVILVLLEEVQRVTQSVYALVVTHSYIMWADERNARELFWTRLQQSMNIRNKLTI